MLQFAANSLKRAGISTARIQGPALKREAKSVTDEDVARAIDLLREQQVKFEKVERELRTGDIAVVNYAGTCEGKPITDIAPTASALD
jgi:FKBP-type peptidyl-prolyl cis-trans isomerase (trigger factor)